MPIKKNHPLRWLNGGTRKNLYAIRLTKFPVLVLLSMDCCRLLSKVCKLALYAETPDVLNRLLALCWRLFNAVDVALEVGFTEFVAVVEELADVPESSLIKLCRAESIFPAPP